MPKIESNYRNTALAGGHAITLYVGDVIEIVDTRMNNGKVDVVRTQSFATVSDAKQTRELWLQGLRAHPDAKSM